MGRERLKCETELEGETKEERRIMRGRGSRGRTERAKDNGVVQFENTDRHT